VKAILERCRKTIVVENNFTGQFARHLRAESGFGVDFVLTRYDGEPFEPTYIVERVKAFREGRAVDLRVQEHEAREIAYHYDRIHMQEKTRPARLRQAPSGAHGEPVWEVELVSRADGSPAGQLVIGMDTGSIHRARSLVTSPGALEERRN
jgi:hypothetical protein